VAARRPRGQGARRALFAVLPLVILVVGGELALRASGWPKKDPKREFTHGDVYWVEPGSQHKEAFPHKETGGSFRVSTDANGLRAPLHAEEKPEGTFRVMTLGCSTTFGWGVDDEATYPARLEAILQEEGRPVEVINGGQPGHTSFQGLWLWEKALSRYAPDLVIFGYIVQDARKVAYSDRSQAMLQGNADFLKQNVLYRSHLYMGLLSVWQGFRMEQKEAGGEAGVYRVPPEEYVENIRAFQARAEAVGAKFMLFGFPLEREGYTTEHRGILRAAASQLSVPYYDPQADFERYSAVETLFFPQDRGHANAAGLDKLAQGMARYLGEQSLIPAARAAGN
jgi:lysophospholipase L1-like esterase